MRDLFSQCVYVRTCWSHLGMSICSIAEEYQLEVTLGMSICAHAWIRALNDNIRTFLGDGGWGGQHSLALHNVCICRAKCLNEC